MELVVADDYEALSWLGAARVAEAIRAKPSSTMVAATGNTPMGMYAQLAERCARERIEPAQLLVFQLDEYLGLGPGDPRSLYGWMHRSLLKPLKISEASIVRLAGDDPDPWEACRLYEAAVHAAGGFDLSILGLGPNGHLGFNEPPSLPDAPTRVVDLTEESIASNGRYWGDEERFPRRALTCGMDLLLAARETLLVVSGAGKHKILRRVIEGPQTPEVPASHLQSASNVTVMADREAWHGVSVRDF